MTDTAADPTAIPVPTDNGAYLWRFLAVVAIAAAAFVAGNCASPALALAGVLALNGGNFFCMFLLLCCIAGLLLLFRGGVRLFNALLFRQPRVEDAAWRKRALVCGAWGLACFGAPFAFVLFASFYSAIQDAAALGWYGIINTAIWYCRGLAAVCFFGADRVLRRLNQSDESAAARMKQRAAIFLTLGVASLAIPALMQMWLGL